MYRKSVIGITFFEIILEFVTLFRQKIKTMTTIIIDTRTKEAKKMVEFLKTTRYAKIVEITELNDETLEAINAVEEGNVNSYSSARELISSLKKKAGV